MAAVELGPDAGGHLGRGVGGGSRMPARSPYCCSRLAAVLSPDALDAGQPVGGVAAHHGEVDVLLGKDAVLLHDRAVGEDLEVADAAGDVQDADLVGVVDQLEEVAVAGHDVDRRPRSGSRASRSRRRPRSRPRRPRRSRTPPAPPRSSGPAPRAGRASPRCRRRRRPGAPPGGSCSSGSGRPATAAASRCPSSTTRSVGWCVVTSRAMKSSRPRTALTGVPSGALISGTPKKARK